MKASREEMLEVVRREAKVRPGLRELAKCCRRKGYRLVIVSNGLRFYIEDILHRLGITDVGVFASETVFNPQGLKVEYIGPDGAALDDNFKLAYTRRFLAEGYRVIYIGDGSSDISPACRSHRIFATESPTDSLLKHCRAGKIACTPFTDFHQIARCNESL